MKIVDNIENSPPLVPAVNRVFNILEYLAKRNEPAGIKEISTSLNIPASSAFRLIKQLLLRQYIVESAEQPGLYQLGMQILTLAGPVIESIDIRKTALNEMTELSISTMNTVQLGVLSNDQVMYIEQISPPTSVMISTALYETIPVNVSAIGKVILANMPINQMNCFFKNAPFANYTSRSKTTKEALMEQFPQILNKGYAIDDEEFSIGIGCLAAPIFNYRHECIAGIGITGHIHAFLSESRQKELAVLVMESAKKISAQIGGKKDSFS